MMREDLPASTLVCIWRGHRVDHW